MAVFCDLIDEIKKETSIKETEKEISYNVAVKFRRSHPWTNMEAIVDDVMLHSEDLEALLQYLECFLKVCVHYRLTINL